MKARARSAVTTFSLLALVAVAVAYAWFGVEKKGESDKARKEAEEQLFAFDKSKLKELSVEAKGSSVTIVRAGPGWRIASPVEADADAVAVQAIIDRIATLKRRSRVAEPDAGSLASYGLERPKAFIAFALEDGRAETLALGDENAFDGSVFVRPTSGAVERVGGDVRFSLEKDLFALREKRLFPYQESDITRLEVKAPSGAYTLERSGGEWRLSAPVADRADDAAAAKVVGAVRGMQASEFVASPRPDQDHGLDRPAFQVRVAVAGGATRSAAIGIPPRERDTARYLRLEGSREVAKVAPAQVADLEQPLLALRDKSALRFEPTQVRAVRFEAGGAAFEVQRGADAGGEWRLVSPRSAPAKGLEVNGLLKALSSLKAASFADETGKRLREHGLAPPARVVVLLGEEGKELGRLEVGAERGERVFARGSASPRILALEKAKLAQLPRSPDQLEDKPAGPATPDAGAAKGG
jgi:hypothetical protein